MQNLIHEASRWLQSDQCREGSIVKRTSAVVNRFREYVSRERVEIQSLTGLSQSQITFQIDIASKTIRQILSAFLRGNHQDALQKTKDLVRSMKFETISTNIPLYKCRENSRQFHYSKDEMFHIPYDKRSLVGNQRYSVTGLPCLYLGGSSYICWEEIGRKDLNTTNFCGYSIVEEVDMFNMLLPSAISSEEQLKRIVLILACSLTAKRDDVFKPEYILPQCVLHSLIHRSYYSHKPFCIGYYSSHLLGGDADYFECDYENKDLLSRYINYVVPMPSSSEVGYNDKMRNLFNQTDSISLLNQMVLHPERLMNACSGDAYLDSQFGLIDSILDVKLGFTPKRKEGDIILATRTS